MTTTAGGARGADIPDEPPGAPSRLERTTRTIALALLLTCLVCRCFLPEVSFRTSLLRVASFNIAGSAQTAGPATDHDELSRVTFAVLLLAAVATWLVGGLRGTLRIRRLWLAGLIGGFAAMSLAAALHAADRRTAMDVWLEQVSLLGACFLAAQLCADRGRFNIVIVVLAALGVTMAAKGLWQAFIEIPARIEDFDMYRDRILTAAGIASYSPSAKALESRIRDTSVLGFFPLSNMFGSLLILLTLAAVGLAADKMTEAVRAMKAAPRPRAKGEIDLGVLSASLATLLALPIGAVLLMTHSRGAIIGGAAALAAMLLVSACRERLARHWKKAVLIAAALLVVGVAATTAYGLRNDRLPTKSMTFRWYYWTASARIILDHPWLGVGPGNFPSTYLQYRRPAAEEAVKMPHNVLMHAPIQFGVPGGLLFLAIIGAVLAASARPREERPSLPANEPTGKPSLRLLAVLMVILPAAVMPAKLAFDDAGADAVKFILEAVLPAGVLAAAMAALAWNGDGFASRLRSDGRYARIALACAGAGFVLHNMVEYTLWTPGTALAFWTAMGACLARSGKPVNCQPSLDAFRATLKRLFAWGCSWPTSTPKRDNNVSLEGGTSGTIIHHAVLGRALAAVLAPAAVLAAAAVLWWPVYVKTLSKDQALAALHDGDYRSAARHLEQAGQADPLDALPLNDAAKLYLSVSAADRGFLPQGVSKASALSKEAMARDTANYVFAQTAAMAAWYEAMPDALTYSWENPPHTQPAMEALLKTLNASPPSPMLLSQAAAGRYLQGNSDEAAKFLQLAIGLDGKSAQLRFHLAGALWQSGQKDAAMVAWQRGRELIAAVDQTKALKLMEQAVRLNPMDMRQRLTYAQLLAQAGQGPAALGQAREIRRIDAALFPESAERLNPAELHAMENIEALANPVLW